VSLEPLDSRSHQFRTGAEVPVSIRDIDMAEVSGQRGQARLNLPTATVPPQQGLQREAMAKMPNSAFAPECRVPENAERRRLGLDFSQLADRALGIVRCLLLTSCGREMT